MSGSWSSSCSTTCLFQWFVGLSLDDAVWDATTFTKNRDRLLTGDIAEAFFQEVLAEARAQGLLSTEHFTVDGTLAGGVGQSEELSAARRGSPARRADRRQSRREFPRRRRGATTRISRRPIPTRAWRRKGRAARRNSVTPAHVLMENRHGFVVDTTLTPADGYAEIDAALVMLEAVAAPAAASPSPGTRPTTRDIVRFRHTLYPAVPEVATMLDSNRATYAYIVVLSNPSANSESILSLGQSGFIAPDGTLDPHFRDQFQRYRNFEYKPMRLFVNAP